MRRAPKKYADADQTVVTPEWLAWRDQAREEALSEVWSSGDDPARYLPEQFDKAIPEDGCWILILEEPFTELTQRFRIPLLSMWRARPHTLNVGGITLGHTAASRIHLRPKQAVIATPGGELHLWPHEYHVVTDPYELMACEGATIHELGGQPVLDEEQVWYLQSRGLAHHEAVLLLIDQVKAQDFVYVTFPEEVTAQLDGVAQPLWRHLQRNRRPGGEPFTVRLKGTAS